MLQVCLRYSSRHTPCAVTYIYLTFFLKYAIILLTVDSDDVSWENFRKDNIVSVIAEISKSNMTNVKVKWLIYTVQGYLVLRIFS